MRIISPADLIINPDGSVFHLHLLPGELSQTIILVGDPDRVALVSSYFDSVELLRANREFHSCTGMYNGERLSVVSTGIGCDNIDIVVNEIDALFNIDFTTRTERADKVQLTFLRLGTSGALQRDIRIGQYVMSLYSIGIDGLLNFYDGGDKVSNMDFENEFVRQMNWGTKLARPYVVENDKLLADAFRDFAIEGVTISAGGFYAPQGRVLRLGLSQKDILKRAEEFEYQGSRITNFEMESSAIAALSALMGHRALTVCAIIAQRVDADANADYQSIIRKLIEKALKNLTK